MSEDPRLDPDLVEAARVLVARGRLLAEREPDLYRTATRGRTELAKFFDQELGWTVVVLEPADMVRLHKRREDVPGDRGPRLRREGRETDPVPRAVLVLSALVCEQLWRRPRMTLNDLLQAVAQVCAADSKQGLLPRFVVVPGDGVSKREAHANRQGLVDALRVLEGDGTVTVDADLDRAAADDNVDLVVAASRDRLAAKFSSLSPSLLRLSDMEPRRHVRALTADALAPLDEQDEPDAVDRPDDGWREPGDAGEGTAATTDATRPADDEADADADVDGEPDGGGPSRGGPGGGTGPGVPVRSGRPDGARDTRQLRRDTDRRRRRAVRRLVDDPGVDPVSDDYLQTSTGRNRALNVLHVLGLAATVRRDWWQVADPSGLGSALDFPNGRRSERQAALALLDHLSARALTDDGREPAVDLDEVVALFERVREGLPRWAAAYDRRLPALARAAATELVGAGFLRPRAGGDNDTPGRSDADPQAGSDQEAGTDQEPTGARPDRWFPTPAVRMWRVRLRVAPPPPAAGAPDAPLTNPAALLFDT